MGPEFRDIQIQDKYMMVSGGSIKGMDLENFESQVVISFTEVVKFFYF